MDKIKKLDNIEPFNEIFYKKCFYNSLFPVVKHFKRSIIPILIDDVTIYHKQVENSIERFSLEYLPRNGLEYTLDDIGIICKSFEYRENLIDNIINSLSEDKPVIINVDSFYEPFRKDTFKKKHLAHSLLVYGYNEDSCTMDIIEHKHRDYLSYECRIINYIDINNSYVGFYVNLDENKQKRSYYEFELKMAHLSKQYNNSKLNDYIKTFTENYKERYDELFYGLEQLRIFSSKFKELVLDESALNNVIDSLIEDLNTIINVKRVERYKVSKLFGDTSNLVEIQQKCLEHWSFIRTIIAKYKYSNIYIKENFANLGNRLRIILELEELYYRTIVM